MAFALQLFCKQLCRAKPENIPALYVFFSQHVQCCKSWVIHGRMFLKLRSNGLFFFPSQIMHLKYITFFQVLLLDSLLHSFFAKYSPSLSTHPTVSNCFCLFLTLSPFSYTTLPFPSYIQLFTPDCIICSTNTLFL